ncbi:MAG: UbiA family prenyltransferase [Thaumarchaeota archaeon]|nr:UbiA family prenyltransferase [Nitrososphaerota archaeon]
MAIVPVSHESDGMRKIILPFSTLFSIVRSRTLVYAFALAATGTFLLSSGVKIPDFFVLVRLVISVYFLALATYLYNDLTDYEVDKENSRDSKYSSKKANYSQILFSTIGFFVVSILLAFSINMQTGIGSLVFLGLAIVYSHPKIQLKKIFVIKTLVTSSGGFVASLMGALAVNDVSYIGISASLIFFLMYFVNGPLGDIGDINGDRKGGRRTIPIVLGVKKTFGIILGSVSMMALILLVDYYFFGLPLVGLALGLTICMFFVLKIKKLFLRYENKKNLSHARTTVRLGIFAIQISMFTGMVLSKIHLS